MLFRRYEAPMLQWLQQSLSLETAKAMLLFGPVTVGALVVLGVAFRAITNRLDLEASDERNLAAFRMGLVTWQDRFAGSALHAKPGPYMLAFRRLVLSAG